MTVTLKVLRLLVTLALLLPATAEAAYVRIWRGHQKAGLADGAFLRTLNHALLPATGELAHGPARLRSYLPVVLPRELVGQGLPAETALLAYDSEDAYRAYRATPEGIHYGDMHWDLFNRDTSASLVPVPFVGELAIEKAYEVVAGDPTWAQGIVTFRVVSREQGHSDAAFLASLAARVEKTRLTNPLAYYVLVSRDYALEYLAYPTVDTTAALPTSFETRLPFATELTFGTGVRYPVANDRALPDTRAVWQRHIAAWDARDLDAIVADYTDDAVVIRNDEIYRGRAQIRTLFADLFARFDRVEKHTIDRVIQESNTVYLAWTADGHLGTDTFVIAEDRIVVQTIWAEPKF